jgi:N-sulfoglucosamine sulfohydrolase
MHRSIHNTAAHPDLLLPPTPHPVDMPNRNILLIVADDLGRNLGCYGEKVVRTPHLDALAASATMFDMAFASTASCSGSRSVIYTGLHTHQNGQYGLQHFFHHFMTHDHVETLPTLFNAAGYLTGIIGKVHVGPDAVYPWTVREESSTRDVQWVADRAGAFFRSAKASKQPFHLTVGFMDPHRDSTRSGFANDQYPGAQEYNPGELEVPGYLTDLPAVREEMASYFGAISRMDLGVGKILERLEAEGLAEETMVVFVSDNGPPFLNSKTTLYDAGVRLPLIVRVPGWRAAVNPTLVSFVDLLPTWLDFAGIRVGQSTRRGRSLLPLVSSDEIEPGWLEVFGSHTFHELTNYYPTRFVRTKRYKYHRNVCWKLDFPFSADLYASKSWEATRNMGQVMIGKRSLAAYVRRGPEELYDLQEDPLEVVNLAEAEPELVLEFRRKLEAWQRNTEDPWLFRDGVSVRSMAQYIGEDGWKIQDRFDFELDQPGEHA